MLEETQTRYTVGVIQRGTEDRPDEIIAVCRTDKAAAYVAQALENTEPLEELVKACRKMLEGQAVSAPYQAYLTKLIKPFDNQFRY